MSCRPTRCLCCAAALSLGALTTPARAQQPGGFHITETSGSFGLTSQYWDEKHSSLVSTLRQRELLFREEFALASKGYYYHPRLLEWNASVSLLLEQRNIRNEGPVPTTKVDQQGNTWDVRATLFREKPYTGDVYSFRHETLTKQALFNTTKAVITETGFNVRARDWALPSHLHFHHYSYEGQSFDTQRERRNNLLLEGGNTDRKKRFEYTAELNDVDRVSSNQAYRDWNLSTSYTREFDTDQWYSSARARVQSGSLDTGNYDLNSNYTRHWSETLTSNHGLQYLGTRVLGSDSDSLSLNSDIQHQLWKSLRSSAGFDSIVTKLAGGNITRAGLRGALNYTKKIPIGTLGLGLSSEYYVQNQDDLQGTAAVLDEAHTYNLGTPLLLDSISIDTATIVVTDALGLLVYNEGTDYLVSSAGVKTQIDIPIGSLINDGDTLLFDYQYQPSPAMRFDSLTRSASASLRVPDTLDLVFTRTEVTQDLLSGIDDGTIQDTTRTLAQLDTYPLGMTVGASWEQLHSLFAPFERASIYSRANTTLSSGLILQAGAEMYRTRFTDIDGTERGTSINAAASHAISDASYWELSAQARSVDLISDAGQGVFLEGRVGRRVRALDLLFSVRYSDETFDIASDQSQVIIAVSVLRTF